MLTSRLTAKGQITIPKEVRSRIRANPGDVIAFEFQGDTVILRKVRPFDGEWHAPIESTLEEWNSPEDEEAYRDL